MVRRFGFPTLDAAIGKVEYPGLDLSRVRRPSRDQEGARGREGDLPPLNQKCSKTLGFPRGTG